MMDLIEHVPDPDDLLGKTRALIADGGVLAILTPDAGSPVSRALGARWPEVQRAPEHLILFSVTGLVAALRRHGFETIDWHSIGKTSTLATLAADVAPVAPGLLQPVHRMVARSKLGNRTFELDPKTKFVLYSRAV